MTTDPEALLSAYLRAIGADETRDPELRETPRRVTEMLRERFRTDADVPELSRMPVADGSEDLVIVSDLGFHSLCAHHMTPFFGSIDIAYLPDRWIAGFGGINRVVQAIARRPQIQERLVAQVADAMVDQLEPAGIVVTSTARQMCMELTGTPPGCTTTAIAGRGRFAGERAWEIAASLLG